MPQVLKELEGLKILNKATEGGLLKTNEVVREYTHKFIENMHDSEKAKPRWQSEPDGKQKAKKVYADTATSTDDIVEEILRRSYPNYKPGDTVVENYWGPQSASYQGDKVKFRIPVSKVATIDKQDKENKEKAAREALRRRLQGQ
jgi:hypothetical protein